MIITFFGHRSLNHTGELFKKIQTVLWEQIDGHESVKFYCGGYGDFDPLCAEACRIVKKRKDGCEVILVTPYFPQKEMMGWATDLERYDCILYPPLERVPPKIAICRRNEWMVEQADVVIAYVETSFGGAYKSLEYAKKKRKRVINLAKE